MPYALRRGGGVVHMRADCQYVGPRHVEIPAHAAERRRKCAVCCVQCISCGELVHEPSVVVFEPCHHVFCAQCVTRYVNSTPIVDFFKIPCPCSQGWLRRPESMPVGILTERIRQTQAPIRRLDPVDAVEEMVANVASLLQTDQCPHCGNFFVDFDGCIAIQCACNGWFCGLCCEPCADSEDAHRHVRACNGRYFMTFDEWKRRRFARRREHMLNFLRTLTTRHGPLYGVAMLFVLKTKLSEHYVFVHGMTLTLGLCVCALFVLLTFLDGRMCSPPELA